MSLFLFVSLAHATGGFCPAGRVVTQAGAVVCLPIFQIGPKNTGNLIEWQVLAYRQGFYGKDLDAPHTSWNGQLFEGEASVIEMLTGADVADGWLGLGGNWHSTMVRAADGAVSVYWSYHATPTSDQGYGWLYTGTETFSDGAGKATWVLDTVQFVDVDGNVYGAAPTYDLMTFTTGS